jgi:RNA polymerase sigma factor (sigma-70 family)
MPEGTFERAYPLALRAARVRVAGAIATGRLTAGEREDWIQELLIAAWRALPRFDSARGSLRTYIERVVANRCTSLARSRRQSMVEPLETHQHCLSTLDGIPGLERRLDVQGVLDSLAASDRELALALSEYNVAEAARKLHRSRSTLYPRISAIRSRFEAAGFGPGGRPR